MIGERRKTPIDMTDWQASMLDALGAPSLARFADERDTLGRSRLGVALIALGAWFNPLTGLGGVGRRVVYDDRDAMGRAA